MTSVCCLDDRNEENNYVEDWKQIAGSTVKTLDPVYSAGAVCEHGRLSHWRGCLLHSVMSVVSPISLPPITNRMFED